MAHVVLLHSVYGLRPALRAAAVTLIGAGHSVRLPDLFGGRTADNLADGLGLRDEIGRERFVELAFESTVDSPGDAVYVGLSLGGLAAARLAESRGGRGLVLLHGDAVAQVDMPVQVHAATPDPFVDDGAVERWSARGAEVYRYAGCSHLYTDGETAESVAADVPAASQTWARVLEFLG